MTGTLQKLLARYHLALPSTAGNVNYEVMQVLADQLDLQANNVDAIEADRFVDTATLGTLDLIGQLANVSRNTGESDSDYRIRIKAEISRYQSEGTRSAILGFVAAVTGNAVTDIALVENVDVQFSTFRSRYYYVDIPTAGLVAQGYTTQASITAVFNLIQSLLVRVDAGGVLGVVRTGGSFQYGNTGSTDFGTVGASTAATGYSNDSATTGSTDYGGDNVGGLWGGFTL